MVTQAGAKTIKSFPLYGWLGLALILLFWYFNWSLPCLRTHWGFFPLWLGFCLLVDAIVYFKTGDSLITRSLLRFVLLFVISIPVWWLFELINLLTQNWVYRGREYFTDAEFALLASLSFSTVIPAVFEAAELAATFPFIRKLKAGPRVKPAKSTYLVFIIVGLVTLVLELLWPRIFYPFIWVTVYLLIEVLNSSLKYPSLLNYTGRKDWRPVLALWMGGLICGFFWEMWNYYSYPKWEYDLPGLNVLHVFEMPLAGYAGFMAFALELYAVYTLLSGLFGNRQEYLRIS
jgi:hypothetical protein